jgi:hypothetical protein
MRRSTVIVLPVVLILLFVSLACQLAGYSINVNNDSAPASAEPLPTLAPPTAAPLPTDTPAPSTEAPPTPEPPTVEPPTATETPTQTATITHLTKPADNPPLGAKVYDVVSKDTAPEKRAPYGDSYQINRLERPFTQDMTYVPDLDIVSYHFSQDKNWTYISMRMSGTDPNNPIGINFGVELDSDADGFGDYVILASPPNTSVWDTTHVKIYQDTNHDTSGVSASKSDAPIEANGYDTLIYDGGAGIGTDLDLAWFRINVGIESTAQFAFKKTFPNKWFLVGVFADAGLKDVGKLDYVDRFTEEQAGSPVRSNKNYPLKELYSVDNVCREAIGFNPTGYEPQLCPRDEPTPKPDTHVTEVPGCQPPTWCTGQWYIWHQDQCWCEVILY